jgi:hypothetical protein
VDSFIASIFRKICLKATPPSPRLCLTRSRRRRGESLLRRPPGCAFGYALNDALLTMSDKARNQLMATQTGFVYPLTYLSAKSPVRAAGQ